MQNDESPPADVSPVEVCRKKQLEKQKMLIEHLAIVDALHAQFQDRASNPKMSDNAAQRADYKRDAEALKFKAKRLRAELSYVNNVETPMKLLETTSEEQGAVVPQDPYQDEEAEEEDQWSKLIAKRNGRSQAEWAPTNISESPAGALERLLLERFSELVKTDTAEDARLMNTLLGHVLD